MEGGDVAAIAAGEDTRNGASLSSAAAPPAACSVTQSHRNEARPPAATSLCLLPHFEGMPHKAHVYKIGVFYQLADSQQFKTRFFLQCIMQLVPKILV